MGLHLVIGAANTGKTGILHHAVSESVRRDIASCVLLPTLPEVQRTQAEFAEKQVIGVQVQTLDTWAERQWALFGDGRRVVTSVVRALLATGVADQASGPLAGLAGSRGLGALLASLVSRVAGGQAPTPRSAIDSELCALVELYFQRLRDAGMVELGEVMALAGESPPMRDAVFAINRFTDISPAQETVILGLSAHNEVYLALAWESGHPATEAINPLVERLMAAAVELEVMPRKSGGSELDHLERHLFDPPAEPLDPAGAVILCEAAGVEAEAAVIANRVSMLIAEGSEPHDIAVAFRDLSSRRAHLASALATRGIVAAVDIAVPFARTPFGVALGALLRVASGEGTRADMMAFLASPFSGAKTDAVEAFDVRCRKKRIVDTATMLDAASSVSATVNCAVGLAKQLVGMPVNASGERWSALVGCLTEAASRSERDRVDSALDLSASEGLLEAAADLAGIGQPAEWQTFMQAMSQVMVSSRAAEQPGAVYVTEVHRMRARRFRAVVLGGLTVEEFSSETREPLIASILQRLGLPAGTDERLSERMLFYSVVTRARERLVLARQSSDSGGRPSRSSVFWEEVLDLYRTPEELLGGNMETGLLPAETLSLSRLVEAAPAFREGRAKVRAAVAAAGCPAPKRSRGVLSEDVRQGLHGAEYSVTELERYHACPYSWFYDRIVRPKGLDESLDAGKRGTYAHGLMASFYSSFRQAGGIRVTCDNVFEALLLLEEVERSVAESVGITPLCLAEEIYWTTAEQWARSAVKQDASLLVGYEPVAEELRFGAEAGRPFEFEGVPIKGSIDRVDAGEAGLVVTDYKSGATIHGHRSFETYGLFQALIYSEAAQALLGKPAVASMYRSFSSGELRGFWNTDLDPSFGGTDKITGEDLAPLRDWVASSVSEAVVGIEAGEIPCRPRKNACAFCGAKTFCEAAT